MVNQLSEPWAEQRFGSIAADLRQTIAQALTDAHTASRDAQDASGARTHDPYGHTLKVLQFQTLADYVIELLPETRLAKLDRYPLAIVNNYVLYPARSVGPKATRAKEGQLRVPVSMLRRRIFGVFGPTVVQPALAASLEPPEPSAEDLRALLARLGKDVRLVAISYLCALDTGVSDIYWGEAELNFSDGALTFHRGEPIPAAPIARPGLRPQLRLVPPASPSVTGAFDHGTPPGLDLTAKAPDGSRDIEPEPTQPQTSNEEE